MGVCTHNEGRGVGVVPSLLYDYLPHMPSPVPGSVWTSLRHLYLEGHKSIQQNQADVERCECVSGPVGGGGIQARGRLFFAFFRDLFNMIAPVQAYF